ncbi:hypothetical protein Rhe02_67570 [Rhizocola hellebori]|uniref:Radical SAM core domain-containing protein n=1 Tax=Rhizocola hellebori TaxID=1392758 RepID=A0A8J3QFJ4_9ACTN|nr:FxsB family cyclophane-forming radical SAM/SPASM peptide maturase [Rhizocola hellebori]GIH08690.1 hypothetical protein Rhe02_67570 [Rhizocola hellebori]
MPARPAIRQVLLKVHSRCNLSCTYCYIYTFADQTWLTQPRCMSRETIDLAAKRIAEHALLHELAEVQVIVHGGEPLLAGVAVLDYLATTIRMQAPQSTRVAFGLQTNGLLLNEEFLALFRKHGFRVGVSLDGGRADNDRHRRFADGRGSFDGVAAALETLRKEPSVYSGILATIDLRNDPVQTYRELAGFAPPRIDFLLPHGNWETPPPGRSPGGQDTPYGDWLIAAFDEYYTTPTAARPSVRIFDSILSLLMGGPSGSESLGLEPVDLLTVETDGSIEQGDVLKTVGVGQAATGMHLTTHSFDDALEHPGLRARLGGLANLGPQCRQCPLVKVCGGGHYAHRFSPDNGFSNPSVYCPDLTVLIGHVRARVLRDLQPCQP